MSKQFTMSMYGSKEDLYKARAEYWESMFKQLSDQYTFDVYGDDVSVNYDEIVEAMEISGGLDD